MNKNYGFIYPASALFCLALGLTAPAQAQTASQITRPDYAPRIAGAAQRSLAITASDGQQIPAGADQLKVVLSGLEVSGGLPELAEATAEIDAKLRGKTVTGADLFRAAQDLEAAYARQGYVLARVSLPPQTVSDGTKLRLVVTNGYIASVDTTALPERVRPRAQQVIAPLIGKRGVTKTELERRLLLAGDIPGVVLRSTLRAAREPGATQIIVEGEHDAFTGYTWADNSLESDLGRITLGFGVDANNALGLGEVGYLRFMGYHGVHNSVFGHDPRNRQIVAGFVLPLNVDGLWFGMEAVDSRTHPVSGQDFVMLGHYQRLSLRLGYNWIRARDFNTSSTISFDLTGEKQAFESETISADWTRDRLRVLRLSQGVDAYLPSGGAVLGDATLSLGLDDFGARQGTTDLPLSRDGATPDFVKFEVTGRYAQNFKQDQLQLLISAKLQSAFNEPLTSSEQFGLGGFDWLSAYDSGEIQGDTAAALRAEMAFPLKFPELAAYPVLADGLSPYIFAAAGVATLHQPTAVEDGTVHASAYGIGLRLDLTGRQQRRKTTLSLEYAHGEGASSGSDDRFNIRLFKSTF